MLLAPGVAAKDANTFVADGRSYIRNTQGGFLIMQVGLNDKVTSGQRVAVQRNAFGETVAGNTSPVAGEVAVIKLDAMIEQGARLMAILHKGPDLLCPAGGCLDDAEEAK